VKLSINIPDKEIKEYLKQRWSKHIKHSAGILLENKAQRMIDHFLEDNKGEFEKMLKEALVEVLSKYRIRDLNQIHEMLGVKKSF
jgi:hypothetical protein